MPVRVINHPPQSCRTAGCLSDRSDRRRFSFTTEAARELGLNLSCVLEVVLGAQISAGGWYFYREGKS